MAKSTASAADLEGLARRFFGAYGAGELETMRELLAADAVSWISNAEGAVDRVQGRDRFMARLPDTGGATWSTEITQVLAIDERRVMTAIEVRAERQGRTLHNFAAFLTRIEDGLIAELWMVEARPAYSDEFWS
jgi:ketosteroid isomerase-like protein